MKLLLNEVLIQVSVLYNSSFLEKGSEIHLDVVDLKLFYVNLWNIQLTHVV